MSLSKKLCLRSDSQNNHSFSDCLVKFKNNVESFEDNYRRDSFDDRFCDDLSENLLQFLPLEDKLKFECVSKQFQRTVFKLQYEIFINMLGPVAHKIHSKNKDFKFREDFNYYYIEDQSMHSFRALLKKCPNITSIQLWTGYHYLERDYKTERVNEVFRLIIENCNNLRQVFVFNDINESNFKEFLKKIWTKNKIFAIFPSTH